MSNELKLCCPFCGGKPEIYNCYCGTNYYRHRCNYVDFIGTLEAWNRRPIEDAQAARIAELESQVEYLQGELAQSDNVTDKRKIAELEEFLKELRKKMPPAAGAIVGGYRPNEDIAEGDEPGLLHETTEILKGK